MGPVGARRFVAQLGEKQAVLAKRESAMPVCPAFRMVRRQSVCKNAKEHVQPSKSVPLSEPRVIVPAKTIKNVQRANFATKVCLVFRVLVPKTRLQAIPILVERGYRVKLSLDTDICVCPKTAFMTMA